MLTRLVAGLLQSLGERPSMPPSAESRRPDGTFDEHAERVRPLFDAAFYAVEHPDSPSNPEVALVDYVCRKQLWTRRPNPAFDGAFYLDSYPDVAQSGLNPLEHYVVFGAKEGRWPAPDFDPRYYLEQYVEARTYPNPLAHYLAVGHRAGLVTMSAEAPVMALARAAARTRAASDELERAVSRIFDASFYREAYSDVRGSDAAALNHFLRHGMAERRVPNRYFSPEYYAKQNDDVVKAGADPLRHYLLHGWREGRDPGPDFDTAWYLARYPEAQLSGFSPLEHFLHFGQKRGFMPVRHYEPDDYLPAPRRHAKKPRGRRKISVVIPIYEGLAEAKACIESVLATRSAGVTLVIVNDASPNPDLVRYLSSLAKRRGVVLLENRQNSGFVVSVNRGFLARPADDIVILNSDTLVSGDWLERLRMHAYGADDVGTVTPFSNNATICSYPRYDASNQIPVGLSARKLDAVFRTTNAGRSVEIPTGVGFCMYVRRDCLERVGAFDEEAFGRGYGEENDFCMRATKLGFRHLLAADTFVYHAGGVSFGGENAARKKRAIELLVHRYPDYPERIQQHLTLDPARPYRDAVTSRLLYEDPRPVVLMVSHDLGGGTTKHVRELAERRAGDAHHLLLRADGDQIVRLTSLNGEIDLDVRIRNDCAFGPLVRFLKNSGVSRVHVHHVLGVPLPLEKLIDTLRVPFEFTVHDYFAVCPQVRLTRNGRYCGEPDIKGCNACLAEQPVDGAADIVEWRRRHDWLFERAERVLCPSEDVLCRIRRYKRGAPLVVVPHEANGQPIDAAPRRLIEAGQPLVVAAIGALSNDKGGELFVDCARRAKELGLPLEFRLIGFTAIDLPPPEAANLSATGKYDDQDLPRLIRQIAPDLVWFPARWPETYSYALSAALAAGLPVVVPNLGAFPERVAGRAWSWVIPWDGDAKAMAERLCEIRERHFVTGIAPEVKAAGRLAARGRRSRARTSMSTA